MIRSVSNFNYSASFRGSAVNSPAPKVEVSEQGKGSIDAPASKTAADAMKSYALASTITNPIAITKPISLDDYKRQLLNSGFVENKDFKIFRTEINGKKYSSIYIQKNLEDPKRVVDWDNGEDANSYSGYKDLQYEESAQKDNVMIEAAQAFDRDGNLDYVSATYKNPTDSEMFPKFINYDTKAEDYIKTLKDNGTKFTIEENSINENGTKKTIIKETDDNGFEKVTFFDEFPNHIMINQDIKDEKGRYRICLDNYRGRKTVEITGFQNVE